MENLRSNAQDLIMKGDLDGALKELTKFTYFHAHPTTMERGEQYHHNFMEAKIHRWKADFSKQETNSTNYY